MQNEDLLGFQSLKERQAPNRSEYLFALTSTILPRSADYEVKLTPDHESLRNTIRDFAEKQIRPIAAEIDRKNYIPRELLNQIAKLGLTAITYKEEYGGLGADLLAVCMTIRGSRRGSAAYSTVLG